MERAKRFELFSENSQVADSETVSIFANSDHTQIRAQIADVLGLDLSRVVASWSSLSLPLQAAILAIVGSSMGSKEDEK